LKPETKRVALAILFGVIIFLSKTVVPSPIDKMFIVVQGLLLALAALLLPNLGATYVAVIGGALTALWRIALAPFTFGFSLLYGLLVDGFFLIFKVDTAKGNVETTRLVASMTVSTALVGFLSYYANVFILHLLERNPLFDVIILVVGTFSGAIAGYLASVIWNRYLKNVKL